MIEQNLESQPLQKWQVEQQRMDLLTAMVLDFTQTLDVNATLMQALETITAHLNAEGGAVFLWDETQETLECVACCGATEITGIRVPKGKGIVGESVDKNESLLVRDVQNDPRFFGGVDDQTGFVTRSILCAPLSVKDQSLGAIELVNKQGDTPLFTEQDAQALNLLAASAALALMNAKMAQAVLEQERVRREVELAAEIQRRFLPQDHYADDPTFPLYGMNMPARGVSGDFYDYFQLPDGRFYFALGDVSGKGVNAALLMSKTASLFRCLGKTITDPARLLHVINDELCETAAHGMFVTMVAGIYDPRPQQQGCILLANAGHEPALVLCHDRIEYLEADGPPLGVLPSEGTTLWQTQEVGLKGGQLWLYTDGLTEGKTTAGEDLGAAGVVAALMAEKVTTLQSQGAAVVAALAPLGAGESLRDDITLLAVDDRSPWQGAKVETGVKHGVEHPEEGQKVLSLSCLAQAAWLRTIRACVRDLCQQYDCTDMQTHDIVLALDEACQNIIRHGYGGDCTQEIVLTVYRHDDDLIFCLRDFAPMIDSASLQSRALDDIRPGGLGLHLIQATMDDVALLTPREGQGNIMRMRKKL